MKDLGAHSVAPLLVASMLGTSIAQLLFFEKKQEQVKTGPNSEAGSWQRAFKLDTNQDIPAQEVHESGQ